MRFFCGLRHGCPRLRQQNCKIQTNTNGIEARRRGQQLGRGLYPLMILRTVPILLLLALLFSWVIEVQDAIAKHVQLLPTLLEAPDALASLCNETSAKTRGLTCQCELRIFSYGSWKKIFPNENSALQTNLKPHQLRVRRWRLSTTCKGFEKRFTLLRNKIVL